MTDSTVATFALILGVAMLVFSLYAFFRPQQVKIYKALSVRKFKARMLFQAAMSLLIINTSWGGPGPAINTVLVAAAIVAAAVYDSSSERSPRLGD